MRPLLNIYAFFVWFISALFLCYKYLLEVSPAVMSHDLLSTFHMSGAGLGNLAACYFYAYLLMQIPMGVLVDRFGARRVIAACLALCGIGTLLLAYSQSVWLAGLGRFITGIGAASAALGCLKLTSVWFPTHRFAVLAGAMMSIGMLGAVFGEAPLSIAVEHWHWRDTLIALGIFGIGFAVIFMAFVRDNGPYAAKSTSTKSLSLRAALMSVLKHKQTWILSVYSGFAFAPVSVFGGLWGVPYLQAAFQFSRTNAAEAVSLVFVGFAVGAPLAGWLSDRIGRRLPIMWFSTSAALVFACLVLYWPNLSIVWASAFLFCFGLFISGFLLCFSMVREVNLLILAATAIGFMNTFDALLGALTDPFVGWLLDKGWQGDMQGQARVFPVSAYHWGMSVLVLYLIVALCLLPLIKETYCQQHTESA